MKQYFLLTMLVVSLSTQAQVFSWFPKATFAGAARYEAASFVIGTKGYVCTGANFTAGTAYADLWMYNQSTNTWTQKANFPGQARYGAAGFDANQRGYVATGWTYSGTQLQDVWEYNPGTNNWVSKGNFGGPARYDAFAAGISSNAYMGFGYAPLQNDWWKYNALTNTWTQKASFPGTARQSVAGFVLNSLVYIGTGYDGSPKNDFWVYNPAGNVWTQKANYTGTARYAAISFAINGYGFLGSGTNGTSFYNNFKKYDPASNTWTAIDNMPGTARMAGEGFAIGDKGYAGLGRNGTTYFTDFYEYAPDTLVVTVTHTNISCKGSANGTAQANTQSGTGPYAYFWSNGQISSSISNLGPGTYTVTASDANGNTGTATVVITQPAQLLVSMPVNTDICQGQTATLTPSVSGGTLPYQYLWNNGKTTKAISQSPSASTTYTITVTDSHGCTTTSSANVRVHPYPNPLTIALDSGFACSPDSVELSVKYPTGNSFTWKRNGITISGANKPVYYAKTTGTYKVILTGSTGCSATSSNLAVTVKVVTAAISPSGTVNMCHGDSLILTATQGSGYAYQWRKNGTNINGATATTYKAKTGGNYKILVTHSPTGCKALSPATTVVVNCRESGSDQVMYVYPNPSSGGFYLEFDQNGSIPVYYSVMDLSGRIILQDHVESSSESIHFGEDLQPGLYMLYISTDDGSIHTTRLIKAEN